LVFSLNDPQTLSNLESWVQLLHESLSSTPIIFLIGTKADLPIKVDPDSIWDFRKKYRIENYFETSALTGLNVERLFEEFAVLLSISFEQIKYV
jgi:GTPase SAR1 family protein